MTDQIAPDTDPTTLPAALVELRQARTEIARLRPFVDMADQAARAAERMRTAQGRCPACRWTTLFLGDGGHVTCSRLECPEPEAADRMLHGEWGVAAAADTAPDIPADKNGPTIVNGQVSAGEVVDNRADTARDLTAALRERRHPIRQYPDELREKAEGDMLRVFPPPTADDPDWNSPEDARYDAPGPERSDIGTEFVHQIDHLDEDGLAAFEADLASKAEPKAASKPAPCRTTQHCAYHGWCHRCAPDFAAAMSRINVAIQRTDPDESHWGPLYEAIGKALNNGEECPRTTADNPPTSSDTPDNPLRDQS